MNPFIIRVEFKDGFTCGYTTLANDLAHAKHLARKWARDLGRRAPFTLSDQTATWQAAIPR